MDIEVSALMLFKHKNNTFNNNYNAVLSVLPQCLQAINKGQELVHGVQYIDAHEDFKGTTTHEVLKIFFT